MLTELFAKLEKALSAVDAAKAAVDAAGETYTKAQAQHEVVVRDARQLQTQVQEAMAARLGDGRVR